MSHDEREELDSEHVLALDPQSQVLAVPRDVVIPTLAEESISRKPSVCLLFLEGRCHSGTHCRQLHAPVEVIQGLRSKWFEGVPDCCPYHSQLVGSQVKGAPLNAECPTVTTVQLPGGSTVQLDRIASTRGITSQLSELRGGNSWPHPTDPYNGERLVLAQRRVCGHHSRGRCRFADACNDIHICKEKTAAAPTSFVPASSLPPPRQPQPFGAHQRVYPPPHYHYHNHHHHHHQLQHHLHHAVHHAVHQHGTPFIPPPTTQEPGTHHHYQQQQHHHHQPVVFAAPSHHVPAQMPHPFVQVQPQPHHIAFHHQHQHHQQLVVLQPVAQPGWPPQPSQPVQPQTVANPSHQQQPSGHAHPPRYHPSIVVLQQPPSPAAPQPKQSETQ